MAYDSSKVVNKVYLGAEGTGEDRNLVIDMTLEGDTPASKTSITVKPIETSTTGGAYTSDMILDSTLASSSDIGNKAWSSSGHLVTGTCLFNADVSGDTLVAADVIEGETFHAGTGRVTSATTGTMLDLRDNKTGTGKTYTLDITDAAVTSSDAGKLYFTNDSTQTGIKLAGGSYGTDPTVTGSKTTITIEGLDNPSKWDTGFYIFGVEGTRKGILETHTASNAYLDSWEEELTAEEKQLYAGMEKCVIPDTPVDYAVTTSGQDAYTCYIGQYNQA